MQGLAELGATSEKLPRALAGGDLYASPTFHAAIETGRCKLGTEGETQVCPAAWERVLRSG